MYTFVRLEFVENNRTDGEPMSKEQQELHRSLILLRNNEINLRWTRTQIFFFINSGAMSLALTQFKSLNPSFYRWSCVVGFLLALMWFFVSIRANHFVSYWDGRLAALEIKAPSEIAIFSGPEWAKASSGIRASSLLLALSGLFVLIWIFLFVSGPQK